MSPRTAIAALISAALVAGIVRAAALHEEVDRLIVQRAAGQTAAPPADDAEFLRRVYLDFAGDIPTATESRAFHADQGADKREKLLASLLGAPRFAERLADALNVILMERRGENAAWREYLAKSCREGKPWDVMAREILSPDFRDEAQRGAGWFITRRLDKNGQQAVDYPGLTRDVGRMFMGVDLQCAQCHNHLTVKGYKQVDFNGLFVAYQNVKLNNAAGEMKTQWTSEGALAAKYEFVSVLTSVKGQTGPRVPFTEEVPIPEAKGDEQWLVKPDRKANQPGVPKFSPVREIAARIATKDNPWFTRNIANRVWWLIMGRGLVEPLDLNHTANPPSHPELLDLLANEFAAHDFNLQWFVGELARTQVYQRSSRPPAKAPPENAFLVAIERPLSFEQLLRTFLQATGELEPVSAVTKADEKDDAKRFALADFETAFRAAFANDAKEPELKVNPTLRSALFLRNGDATLWALQPREGNLVTRVAQMSDAAQAADELYLSILTRLPTEEEKAEFSAWLEKHGTDRPRAVGHFAWALLSSAEFFSNH